MSTTSTPSGSAREGVELNGFRWKHVAACVGLALAAPACVPRTARNDSPGVPVPRGIIAADARRAPECERDPVRVACDDMISRAQPLDFAGTGERMERPTLTRDDAGRLRYSDTVRIARKETVYSVRSSLELDFGAEGWTKVQAPPTEPLHFTITRAYGRLDLVMTVRQIGQPTPAERSLIEVVAVMRTLDPVT